MSQVERPPTVTVCVATFNQAQYLERCINSIFAQDAVTAGLLNIEVIVGDDCSTDATDAVLGKLRRIHGTSLIVVRHGLNIGPAFNYLSILSKASGDYIAHLDGDDYWDPGKLGAQIGFLGQHPDIQAVCTNARVVNQNEGECGIFTNVKTRVIDLEYLTASGNFLNHSSLLYRRAALSTVCGLVPPFIDYAILLALAHKAPIGFIEQPLVCYRAGLPGSIQRLHGGQVQDLYRDALFAALPLIRRNAARRGAANYVAYRIFFALRSKVVPLDLVTLTQLAAIAHTSRPFLAALAAARACVLVAKAGHAWVLRRLRGAPFVHHPRY
ncbi:glycosyltransferase family 2 protein [Variovorax paradoxus]|uniref:glycosyltransferase family 2 protein n=1 Tax=Variovorax paradoxus TaxID=34073 RepID=UPI00278A4A6F|nr:glycosyltransferase [Variovorax paradoxus]MDP9933166.1 glycosyltransferase involved in cell wall biosynthesis [Variovorax paradoxus]